MTLLQALARVATGLRLHLNENTGGCSPRVLEAMRALPAEAVATYPDYTGLVQRAAARYGVDPAWVLPVNGLDEGILLTGFGHIGRARDAESVVTLPLFDAYVNATEAAGGTAIRVAPGADFAFPAEAVLAALTPRTRLIFVNTPHNPTGSLASIADLVRLCEAAPQAIVMVDEAYIEFGGESFVPWLASYPNAIVGRTLSKAYGLAGLRVGFLLGQPAALDPVRAVTLPFNVGSASLAGAIAALDDPAFVHRYVAEVRESRQRLSAACRRLGFRCWESAGNFVLVQVGEQAAAVAAALAARGVHVRDRSADRTTPGCVRITAGVVAHTNCAIEALEFVAAGVRAR